MSGFEQADDSEILLHDVDAVGVVIEHLFYFFKESRGFLDRNRGVLSFRCHSEDGKGMCALYPHLGWGSRKQRVSRVWIIFSLSQAKESSILLWIVAEIFLCGINVV